MPCTDGGGPIPYPCNHSAEIKHLKARNDELARLLCGLCNEIASTYEFKGPLKEWWDAHQEFDRKRKQKEAEEKLKRRNRKAALDKLTKEERKLLGLE